MRFAQHPPEAGVKLAPMASAALIDVATLAPLIGSPELVLLDCRFDLAAPGAGHRAYLEAHIPTARYADLNRDLSDPVTERSGRHPLPEPERVAAWLRSLGVSVATRLVVYDEATAAFAARAWWLARWVGHERVAVLDGGFRAWVEAGGALESADPLTRPVTFDPGETQRRGSKPDRGAVLDSAGVIQALADPKRLLIDARAPERFSGSVEPIDAVGGHIPGAVNHPFQSNLQPDGRFLARAELERRWRERLAGRHPAEVIAMCGSGVTACQNLLAMEIAGLTGAKLYAGSWSEWIRDPTRPIARGS